MTTTKTQPRTPPTPKMETPVDLQAAYQIHTLAQMMYGQLGMARPWMGAMPPRTSMYGPPAWNEQQAFTPQAFCPLMPMESLSSGMTPCSTPYPWVW